MNSSQKILLKTLQGEKTARVPFWFMRQAGRYLPEYRGLRAQTKSFLEFCYSPDKAKVATLQPIERFGMDGAIIFSDILVIPHALGMDVRFEEGKGPILVPVKDRNALEKLNWDKFKFTLSPVYDALRATVKTIPPETSLIGFIGAPWTLACYVVEGKSSADFAQVKAIAAKDREFFSDLISLLTKAVILHAKRQIQAGAEIIQLFDSWAGVLDEQSYHRWVIDPAREIVAAIKADFNVPVIGFPRQSGSKFLTYAKETKVDVISFDDSVPIEWARDSLQPSVMVQGCLDPQILAGDKEMMLKDAQKILSILGNKNFIFNLSHGVVPHTPVENMQALCDFLKEQ